MIIKILPHYNCTPIWILGKEDFYEPLEIEDLIISQELKYLIEDWDKTFQDTLDKSDPGGPFPVDFNESEFNQIGMKIKMMLEKEIPESEVFFNPLK